IVHPPGTPNDTHYHEHDEWWVLMRGEINWHIEGQAEPVRARAGDFVLCPKFRNHHLEPVAPRCRCAWRSTLAASSIAMTGPVARRSAGTPAHKVLFLFQEK